MVWETFQDNQFVSRPAEEALITHWAKYRSNKKVYILKSAPGSGKTWLIEQSVFMHGLVPMGNIAFRANISELINPIDVTKINQDRLADLLQEVGLRYTKAGHTFPAFVSAVSYRANIQSFVLKTNTLPGNLTPAVIVLDGWDELSDSLRRNFCVNLLNLFLQGSTKIQILIASRVDFNFKRFLADIDQQNMDKVTLNSAVTDFQQFDRIKQEFYPHASHVDRNTWPDWKQLFQHYVWDNLYINGFLINQALHNKSASKTNWINAEALEQGILGLIGRSHPVGQRRQPGLSGEEFQVLEAVANWQEYDSEGQMAYVDNWTVEMLSRWEEAYLMQAGAQMRPYLIGPNLEKLTQLAVIQNLEGQQRYEIIKPIRNILRDLRRLRTVSGSGTVIDTLQGAETI